MKDWNTQIEPLINKGLRIFGGIVIILEIAVFSYTAFIMYSFDKTYPLPYIPAWMIPGALAMIIFKTTIISWLIFGKWDFKKKDKTINS